MKFVEAECPNCGAQLQLNNSSETAFCNHCGSKIIVNKAIELANTILMSIEKRIQNGEVLSRLGEYKKAFEVFDEITTLAPERYEGWLGLFNVKSRNSTIYKKEYCRELNNALACANTEVEKELVQKIYNDYNHMPEQKKETTQEKSEKNIAYNSLRDERAKLYRNTHANKYKIKQLQNEIDLCVIKLQKRERIVKCYKPVCFGVTVLLIFVIVSFSKYDSSAFFFLKVIALITLTMFSVIKLTQGIRLERDKDVLEARHQNKVTRYLNQIKQIEIDNKSTKDKIEVISRKLYN